MKTIPMNLMTEAKFARLNKRCTLKDYKQEVESGEFYTEKVKVTEMVTANQKEWKQLTTTFMNDNALWAGKGGTNSTFETDKEDFFQLTEAEQDAWRKGAYRVVHDACQSSHRGNVLH